MKTYIVTISDTHGRHEEIEVPDGDILIHAGDFSNTGLKDEIESFLTWFGSQPHTYKVLIAGNHDKGTDPDRTESKYQGLSEYFIKRCKNEGILLLNDSHCEIKSNNGEIIRIWGSPVQPTFGYGWAWNRNRGSKIKTHWDKIPENMDIIVTHGPAFGYGDRVVYHNERVGCDDLLEALERVKPKMHVAGHIHEDRGVFLDKKNNITYCNTSSLTLRYIPYQCKSFRFDWDKVKNTESYGFDYE